MHKYRIVVGLLAGAAATLVNTSVLDLAHAGHVPTAKGGLLQFVIRTATSTYHLWQSIPASAQLRNAILHLHNYPGAFHAGVGLIMALVYFKYTSRLLPTRPMFSSVLFGILIWLFNAAIVLPAIGEGFAGHRDLAVLGIVWFAAAHFLYFLVLGLIYRYTMDCRVRS